MKKKVAFIILIILIILLVGVICMFIFGQKKKEITSITKLHLSYSNGYMMDANTIYDIDKKDDKYFVTIKPHLIPEEESQTVEIDKKTINKIIEILNKNKVYKWNGFKKSDKYVLDGDSFSFWLYMDDGSDIHASGYMMWPDNYGTVKLELDNILGPLYIEKTE